MITAPITVKFASTYAINHTAIYVEWITRPVPLATVNIMFVHASMPTIDPFAE